MLFLFLEMTLNIDTISTTTHLHCPEDVREAWAIQRSAKEVVIIDSLDIVAHRLFGPLPRTSTYFCIWEFHVGNIAGRLTALEARTLAASGRQFGLNFTDPTNQPKFEEDTQYYTVFFHGLKNISVPIDTKDWPEQEIRVTIPEQFETKGVIVAVVANEEGAPTKESVVAGPGVILEQPAALATKLL